MERHKLSTRTGIDGDSSWGRAQRRVTVVGQAFGELGFAGGSFMVVID